jgi:hypothetical protein
MDIHPRFWFTRTMHVRPHKALLAFVFALSFILNGSAMQTVHAYKPVPPLAMKMADGAMPCHHAGDAEKHHPCCPGQGHEKASCTADCCLSVMPVMIQANTQFTFVQYKPRPKPALVLASRIPAPPTAPPKV